MPVYCARRHSSDSIILSDECVSTKLGVIKNFVSSLYLLIQSSTLKKCIEHCLMALATLLHVYIYIYIYIYKLYIKSFFVGRRSSLVQIIYIYIYIYILHNNLKRL